VTSAAERKRSVRRWALWLSLALPAAAVIIYLLIWYGPDMIARHDIGSVTGPLRALRLQQARDAARGRLLTLGAGLFAAGALLFSGRNYKVARETLEVTGQGQVTDRYTKAIEQLGSKKLDVRIGGIFALERIALDSARDHPTVIEVLAAFIREHSRKQWPKPTPENRAPQRATRPDVQAALRVIGRRDATHDRQPTDLTGANLTGADVTRADLARADFRANLTGANLTGANLTGANLTGANLGPWTAVKRIGLRTVMLDAPADLTGAGLTGANLTDAKLTGANLTNADLTNANLKRADLGAANLTGADLTGVDLTGANFPWHAPVPAEWVRDPRSGRLRRASEGTGDAGN